MSADRFTNYTINEGLIVRKIGDLIDDTLDFAVAGPLKTLEFLGFTLTSTGGNCEAMWLEFEDGLFVEVSEDSQQPGEEWATIDSAIHDGEGGEFEVMNYWCGDDVTETAAAMIDSFVDDMVEHANRAIAAKAGA